MSNYDDIFVTQAEEDAQGREAWIERKQSERQTLYELADATTQEVCADGGKFQSYLDVQSRFIRYSATNALLILAQNPKATQLKDYDSWREAGTPVRKDQKSNISILEPGREYKRDDGSIGVSYDPKKVFDISQTGAEVKAAPVVTMDDRLLLKAMISRSPAPIRIVDTLPDNMGAVYDHQQRTIFVRRGLSAPTVFHCVAKELAHAEMAMMDKVGYNRAAKDFSAFCASYMLCKRYGIDVSRFSFETLPDGLKMSDTKTQRAALSEIKGIAMNISERMSRVLEPNRNAKGREQER